MRHRYDIDAIRNRAPQDTAHHALQRAIYGDDAAGIVSSTGILIDVCFFARYCRRLFFDRRYGPHRGSVANDSECRRRCECDRARRDSRHAAALRRADRPDTCAVSAPS